MPIVVAFQMLISFRYHPLLMNDQLNAGLVSSRSLRRFPRGGMMGLWLLVRTLTAYSV